MIAGRIPVRGRGHLFVSLLLLALLILSFTLWLTLVIAGTRILRGEAPPAALPLFYSWLGNLIIIPIYAIHRWYAVIPMVALSYLALMWAKGRQTVASDVDVLIVYRGEPRADAYSLARTMVDVPGLEPHLYTEAEYRAAAATVGRMIEGGVVLWEAPA